MKRKYLLLFFAGTVAYTSAFTQPVIKRQAVFGSKSYDEFANMDQTNDAGLIIGGYTTQKLSGENVADRLKFNYAVQKLNTFGKIQWAEIIGGYDDDYLEAIRQTSDEGYILGGYSSSNKSGNKSENSRGWSDYWVVKLDNAGNILWDKTIGGSDVDALSSLQQTSDGGYILGGTSASGISAQKTGSCRGENDYWIVKLDKQGNIQWDKTIGGNSNDLLAAIQQTADKGFILGGYSESNKSGEKSQDARGSADYWIVKLDSAGNIQWDKTIGGDDFDELTSLQQTRDGGYVLGGYSYSNISGEKTENSRGQWDYWVVKIDASGMVQWDKTAGGIAGDALFSLQQTFDDGYILAGNSESDSSGEKTENNKSEQDYYVDYWVVKLDKNGNYEWDKTIGGDYDDYLINVKEISENRFLLGGSSNSKISADKREASLGYFDCWLVEMDYLSKDSVATTSKHSDLSIIRHGYNNTFVIYPNPAKDILHVQTNGKAVVSLIDQSGKILFTKTVNGTGQINISSLQPGLYYLKNNTNEKVKKVVVVK